MKTGVLYPKNDAASLWYHLAMTFVDILSLAAPPAPASTAAFSVEEWARQRRRLLQFLSGLSLLRVLGSST
ncbi:hypothetical protein Nepgr_010192 [Nepenthes gracilis]|uniref:Uncharacterized protein n=1 Tax=Nepenthes gracilis TaxID=150966 RepID=A0AAD3XKU5_NEPGR|nr:hypothetical protein Nepgr_010192 [Nepenthes gracilis]